MDRLVVDLDHELLAMPAPLPDRYLLWAENGVAGKAVDHVLTRLLLADDALGCSSAPDPFAHLDAALEASPPGANGLLFLPWMAGSLSPQADRDQRGSVIGLSLESERVDVVRAAVEGTAHNLRWLLPAVEEFCGGAADTLVLGGGAARSAGWAQTLADVLGRPISLLADPDLAAARAVATVALRHHHGDDPLASDGPIERVVHPRDGHGAHYDRAHAAFLEAFGATRPIVEGLQG
jgi:xylulokinase